MGYMLSKQAALKEVAAHMGIMPRDILETLDLYNTFFSTNVLNEAEYEDQVKHLNLRILDIERFVKVNDWQSVTNPVTYVRPGIPSDDGLLSNKIFGITKDDRAGIFSYIDLGGYYIDPSCYKTWIRMDTRVKDIVHGIRKFKVVDGDFVEDEHGETGIDFLRRNIDKITFKSSGSIKRDLKIDYLMTNKDIMFIRKYPVIPAFYRDTNMGENGSVQIGGINKLYSNILQSVNGKQATRDYGFNDTYAMDGRIQEYLLNVYDWFVGNSSDTLTVEIGSGMAGKKGIIHRANMSKTANYSVRLVISAPELKANRPQDMMVNMDYSASPLAAVIVNFRPFVMFHVKRFFENEFVGTHSYPVINKNGQIETLIPKDPMIEFSDERIKREMDRFLHGYNNRFIPIKVPTEDPKRTFFMQFKGRFQKPGGNPESIYQRRLTWCDVFYMAACEAVKDKHILITRFPIDSYFNQITTKVVVSSTKEVEPMMVGDVFYKYYPKIREEDIGTNTGNKFVDTFKMCNLFLPGLGGDYDGDTVSVKGVYTVEANDELAEFMKSKRNFINLGGSNIRYSTADSIQAIYSFTKVLSSTKLTDPVFE